MTPAADTLRVFLETVRAHCLAHRAYRLPASQAVYEALEAVAPGVWFRDTPHGVRPFARTAEAATQAASWWPGANPSGIADYVAAVAEVESAASAAYEAWRTTADSVEVQAAMQRLEAAQDVLFPVFDGATYLGAVQTRR